MLTRWLKDVELRLDSSTFGGLEVFGPLEGFQSQSFFQLLAFSFFCGTLKPELFLFCQSELSVLFSFLGVLLLSLNFGFLSFESCFLLGVQFLRSEQLLLCKPGLSLRFLTETLSLSLITFLFQASFLCFTFGYSFDEKFHFCSTRPPPFSLGLVWAAIGRPFCRPQYPLRCVNPTLDDLYHPRCSQQCFTTSNHTHSRPGQHHATHAHPATPPRCEPFTLRTGAHRSHGDIP